MIWFGGGQCGLAGGTISQTSIVLLILPPAIKYAQFWRPEVGFAASRLGSGVEFCNKLYLAVCTLDVIGPR